MAEGVDRNDNADALVLFMPSGRRGRFPTGTPVLDAARSLGVYVESVCGGRGMCGRCQVTPTFGQFPKHGITARADDLSGITETEERYAKRGRLSDDRRLGCQARIQGDLVIDVPTDTQVNRALVRKRAETRDIALNPATRPVTVTVPEPQMDHPSGDADRLLQALRDATHIDALTLHPDLLTDVQKVLRQGKWRVTAAIHQDDGAPQVNALWPGDRNSVFGIAVDIGSTTIAAHLSNLVTGRTIASAGTANPQIRFGEDLMSRVSYVMMNPGGQTDLTRAVRAAIETLIDRLTTQAEIAADDILEAVFVGNPVMHHLYLGIDPTELGGAPFALAVSDAVHLSARTLGLGIHPQGQVYVLPCIAGHVGADAAAATLAEGPHRSDRLTLLVDVGTNAEIILGNRDRVVAASSPTGPAFEGAEISCGQRAAPGAVERVRIDPETLEPRIRVIGVDAWSYEPEFTEKVDQVGVTGICGSGIIEVIGEMFLSGILSPDGVINGALAEKSDRVIADGRTFAYRLWSGEVELVIRQTDIRAIQLAKAALYAGVRLLMDRLQVTAVERIRLAGAFGTYIDPKYALILGLVPDCDPDEVKSVGNAAGTGARMALLNRDHRREVEDTVRRIEKIETALEPEFQNHFVSAMALPNAVDPFPLLRNLVSMPEMAETTQDTTTTRGRRRRQRRKI